MYLKNSRLYAKSPRFYNNKTCGNNLYIVEYDNNGLGSKSK